MTATLPPAPPGPTADRPATATATGGAPGDGPGSADGTTSRHRRPASPVPGLHLLTAEVALYLLTAAAVLGFARIFEDWSFLAPLLVVATTAHLTVALCRRRGLGLPVAAAATAVQFGVVTTWLFFVDTTVALVPTLRTWDTGWAEVERSWTAFHEIVAPAPVQTGFLLAAAAAVTAGAFLADWAAFRLWSAREAVVPSTTLFVFATLLADDRHRIAAAIAEVGAALLFLLAHRVVVLERSDGWVTASRGRAGRSLLRAGLGLGVVALVVGSLVAPRLPGVDEPALVDWRRSDDAPGSRTLTNPLVDIRSRLVDTSDTPLFTVESPVESYWRAAVLDELDGTRWGFPETTYEDIGSLLPGSGAEQPDGGDIVRQRVTIQEFRTNLLPAAYRPIQFAATAAGPSVLWNAATSTLYADELTPEGYGYEVVSALPDVTADQLRRAADDIPPQVAARALDLPDDFSPAAALLARQVVDEAGATTTYDQALALQQWFREDGGFRYSTDVQITGDDAFEDFLTQREGYCEQFAGTFAAMARTLGIPTRVAVGYTWGEAVPGEPGTYQVLGRNAHAWPEVYLAPYGWVPFEPTPGRGAPGTEAWTGLSADQEDEATPSEATTTTTTEAPAVSTTTSILPDGQVASAPVTATDDGLGVLGAALAVVLAAAGAAGLYLLAVPGSLALRRRRRRARASGSPSAEVGVAWAEATEALAAAGVRARPDETHAELARRGAAAVPAAGDALGRLAGAADAAAFGPAAEVGSAASATAAAAEVRSAVDGTAGRWGRLRRHLDPRPLWAGRPRRHRTG